MNDEGGERKKTFYYINNSKARRGLTVAILFFAAVLSANGFSPQQMARYREADVINTQRIEIVDDSGIMRVVVTAIPGGPTGIFIPNTESPEAFLGVGSRGWPMLSLATKDRRTCGSLYVKPEAPIAGLKFDSPDGNIVIQSDSETTGFSAVRKSGEEASLMVVPGISPGVHLEMKDGQGRVAKLP